MNQALEKTAMPALRWTLGLVVLWESYQFAFSPSALQHFAETGLPSWIRPALAGSEITAAILFLLPAASFVGGCLLLFTFAIAAVLHLLHGQFDVGGLVVYSMVVLACVTHDNKKAVEVLHDR
jgi:hypothetical protein